MALRHHITPHTQHISLRTSRMSYVVYTRTVASHNHARHITAMTRHIFKFNHNKLHHSDEDARSMLTHTQIQSMCSCALAYVRARSQVQVGVVSFGGLLISNALRPWACRSWDMPVVRALT